MFAVGQALEQTGLTMATERNSIQGSFVVVWFHDNGVSNL